MPEVTRELLSGQSLARASWRLLLAVTALLMAVALVSPQGTSPSVSPVGDRMRVAALPDGSPVPAQALLGEAPLARAAKARWTAVTAVPMDATAADKGEEFASLRDAILQVLAVLGLLWLVAWRRRDQINRPN